MRSYTFRGLLLNLALFFLMLFAPAVICSRPALAQSPLMVLAAASTTDAVTEVGQLYANRNLGSITTSFASSSTLAKQIESGAPADIFLSADQQWMDYLDSKNLILKESRRDLLGNRLVLIVPAASEVKEIAVTPGMTLLPLLGQDGRLAVGDPEHVPVGKYGKQALTNLGAWEEIKERLAPTKDVRAALVLVERGEAPLGLVYSTDAAISAKVRVVGTFPVVTHPAIVYPVAAVGAGNVGAAGQFLEFLQSPDARAIFAKHGFSVP